MLVVKFKDLKLNISMANQYDHHRPHYELGPTTLALNTASSITFLGKTSFLPQKCIGMDFIVAIEKTS